MYEKEKNLLGVSSSKSLMTSLEEVWEERSEFGNVNI